MLRLELASRHVNGGPVTAVTGEEHKAPESLASERCDVLPQHLDQRSRRQADRAGEGEVLGGEADRQAWRNESVDVLGQTQGDFLGHNGVCAQRGMRAMAFAGANGHDHRVEPPIEGSLN